jgi:hypothetical protein
MSTARPGQLAFGVFLGLHMRSFFLVQRCWGGLAPAGRFFLILQLLAYEQNIDIFSVEIPLTNCSNSLD